MKRSLTVRLSLMGAATATSLAACGGDVTQPGNFTSLDACVAAGNSRVACTRAFDDASKDHEQRTQKFTSREECARQVDTLSCEERRVAAPGGGMTSIFVPALAGFVLGQLHARQSQYVPGGGGGGYGAIYASRDYPGQYRDQGNLATSRSLPPGSSVTAPGSFGRSTVPSRPPNVSTTTIARSGFGSTSSSFGGSSS